MAIDVNKANEERKAGYPHLTIVSVYEATYGIGIEWCCQNIGFGTLHVWPGRDGKLHADTECMSNEFVMAVFRELVKQIVREE